jgi:hypothetical protein
MLFAFAASLATAIVSHALIASDHRINVNALFATGLNNPPVPPKL